MDPNLYFIEDFECGYIPRMTYHLGETTRCDSDGSPKPHPFRITRDGAVIKKEPTNFLDVGTYRSYHVEVLNDITRPSILPSLVII